MSITNIPSNQYGLGGVGSNIQLGKQGPRFVADANGIEVRDVANATLVNLKVANAIVLTDAVNLSQLDAVAATVSNAISSQVGLQVPLGAFNGNAAYQYTGAVTFTDNTSVTNAIEALNNILSHLVPAAPTNFPTANFSITNSTGNSPVLANGAVTDHTGGTSGYTPGASVTRLTSSTVTTNTITLNSQSPNGLAADLVLTLAADGSTFSTYSFTDATATGNSDNGNHSGIVISAQSAYPSGTPGFWKSFSAQLNGAFSQQGINKAQLTSNEEGNSNILYWVQDNVTATPAVSSPSLTLASNGVVTYSSSVPHYNSGASVTVNLSISNLAGETYYNGNPLSITGTNGIIVTQAFNYSTLGIATPIARQTTLATAVSPFTVNINGTNIFTSGTLSGTATNVNGSGSATALSSTTILVKNGTLVANTIDELNIPVSGHGSVPNSSNGVRVLMTGDASGVDTPNSAAFTAWSAAATLANYEAAVVAGSLSANQTNYASGFLPVGPNLSGHDATQYFTFAFQRSTIANMFINITGTYSHCWIALPGVSDNATISPHSINGVWWDTAVVYNGVGSPGDNSNPNAGCAVAALTGTNGGQVTFGTQNSTNATGNNVLVRFKLTSGQSITALSIS